MLCCIVARRQDEPHSCNVSRLSSCYTNAGPPQRPRAEKLISVLQLNGSTGFLAGRKKKCNAATIGLNLLQGLSAGCCHGDRLQDAGTMRNAYITGREKKIFGNPSLFVVS